MKYYIDIDDELIYKNEHYYIFFTNQLTQRDYNDLVELKLENEILVYSRYNTLFYFVKRKDVSQRLSITGPDYNYYTIDGCEYVKTITLKELIELKAILEL